LFQRDQTLFSNKTINEHLYTYFALVIGWTNIEYRHIANALTLGAIQTAFIEREMGDDIVSSSLSERMRVVFEKIPKNKWKYFHKKSFENFVNYLPNLNEQSERSEIEETVTDYLNAIDFEFEEINIQLSQDLFRRCWCYHLQLKRGLRRDQFLAHVWVSKPKSSIPFSQNLAEEYGKGFTVGVVDLSTGS
jgi:hypothetical protein